MIVHLLSGHNVSVAISENEKVSVVKKRIQETIGKPHEKISLVSNGIILDDDSIMSDYNLSNDSLITAVNPPRPVSMSIEEQEKQVEEYLISICSRLKTTVSNEGAKPTINEEDSIKVFDELADRTIYCRSMEVDELFKGILMKDELLTVWVENDFFGAIVRKPSILREVLLSHPLITKLINLNPGLQEFLDDDNNLMELVDIMRNPNNEEQIHKREKILKVIEQKLGRKLTFAPEHIEFIKECRSRKSTTVRPLPKPSRPRMSITERQRDALIVIASTHPDILVRFIKNTPLYRHLIHTNPKLLKKIFTPEQLQLLFNPSTLKGLISLNDEFNNHA